MKLLLLIILLRITIAIILGLVALLMWAIARVELDLKGIWTWFAIAAALVGLIILTLDLLWFAGMI